jgi:hypothetical protein
MADVVAPCAMGVKLSVEEAKTKFAFWLIDSPPDLRPSLYFLLLPLPCFPAYRHPPFLYQTHYTCSLPP